MAQAAVAQFSAVLDDAVEAERLRKAEEERARLTRALVTAVKTTNYEAVERLTQDQVSPMRLQINDVPADVLHNAEGSAVCHPLCTASLLHILTSALNQSPQTTSCLGSLLAVGADVHARDDAGKTPLHWAATLATLDHMTLLLTKGADANAVDSTRTTPLHCLLGDGIASRDWDSYPILRFSEVPPVDVALIGLPNDPSLGMGECTVGPTCAAIGNAVAHALDRRIYDMPLNRERIMAALLA